MKPNHIIALGWFTCSLLCGFSHAQAQDRVPCLIFTGNSETQHCIDLAKQNRITFSSDGFAVSSSAGNSNPNVKLLYSMFNHIEIGDAVPTETSSIDEIEDDANSRIIFMPDSKSILLESSSDSPFAIGIFSLKGILIATSEIYAGHSLPLEGLSSGMYIAVATDGTAKLTLKFILN